MKLYARVHSMPMTLTSDEPIYRPLIKVECLVQFSDLPQSVVDEIVKGKTERIELEATVCNPTTTTEPKGVK